MNFRALIMRTKDTTMLIAACSVSATLVAAVLATDPPAAPKVSSFAPAEDLVHQVNYFVERSVESLANKDDYPEANQSRVKKDANTLALLALALALHDSDHSLKASAPALVGSAQALAAGSADYDKAKAALENVQKAAKGEGSPDAVKPTEWKKVGSQGQLMKQAQIVYNQLRRGTDARRFKRQVAENAGMAATLAVIGQSAVIDTHEVKNPADLGEWYKLAAEMRDSAAAVNAAIHAGSQEDSAKALQRMSANCEECHKRFRVEVK